MNLIWAIVILAVSYAITALTAKKPTPPQDAQPAALQDFGFPQYEEGTPQSVIFGDVWISDWMVLYYGDLSTVAIRQESGGGKK